VFSATKAGKPFLQQPGIGDPDDHSSAIKFSVSHHGEWVCVALSLGPLIGCDIASASIPGHGDDLESFTEMMQNELSVGEWTTLQKQPTSSERLRMWSVYWSLKESLLKAVGCGLAFDLNTIDFSELLKPAPTSANPSLIWTSAPRLHDDFGSTARSVTDWDEHMPAWKERVKRPWRCETHQLDDQHVCSVAIEDFNGNEIKCKDGPVRIHKERISTDVAQPTGAASSLGLAWQIVQFDELKRFIQTCRQEASANPAPPSTTANS